MVAHAYARLRNKPGVCMAASGPGTTNLVTGVANAWVDCAPVRRARRRRAGRRRGTRRVPGDRPARDDASRSPSGPSASTIRSASPSSSTSPSAQAMSGKPGPVYLDLPGDVLYAGGRRGQGRVARTLRLTRKRARPAANADDVKAIVELLSKAKQPVADLRQRRAVVGGRKPSCRRSSRRRASRSTRRRRAAAWSPRTMSSAISTARSTAFTRGRPDPGRRHAHELRHRPCRAAALQRRRQDHPHRHRSRGDRDQPRRLDVGVVARREGRVLAQLTRGAQGQGYAGHATRRGASGCARRNVKKTRGSRSRRSRPTQTPIHPLRLCKEVRDFIDRDAILCVDGQEILNYGRQSIPSFTRAATASTRAPSAPWASACRSASAPRRPSPTSRSSCCTATARSA